MKYSVSVVAAGWDLYKLECPYHMHQYKALWASNTSRKNVFSMKCPYIVFALIFKLLLNRGEIVSVGVTLYCLKLIPQHLNVHKESLGDGKGRDIPDLGLQWDIFM